MYMIPMNGTVGGVDNIYRTKSPSVISQQKMLQSVDEDDMEDGFESKRPLVRGNHHAQFEEKGSYKIK